jgi:hypothetical protein
MGNDFVIAAILTVVSFFLFLKVWSLFKHFFNMEIPEWLGIVMGLIIIGVLYFKKEFFFGTSIATGITIGFILSLFWNIKRTKFVSGFFKAVFSIKFVLWAAISALGIYKREIMLRLWDKYILQGTPDIGPYILILVVIIYLAGTIFVLFPGILAKRNYKNSSFSMNRRAPRSKIVWAVILGLLMVLVSSPLLMEAYSLISGIPK